MKRSTKCGILLFLSILYIVSAIGMVFAADADEDFAPLCHDCAEENAELTEYVPTRDGAEDYRKWAQTDSRWGSLPLGASGGTVAQYGCTVTAVTKLIIQCGLREQESFDVGVFVRWLNQNDGFTSNGSLYWGKAGSCVPGFSNAGDILASGSYSSTGYNAQIIAWIKAGNHMVINVRNGGHWVAVDEEKSLATGTVYIMDSSGTLANADITLASRYSTFNAIHAYKGGKIAAPEHTCDLNGGYAFVETAHPHYKCYYCSVCGVVQRNYSEPTTREDCLECKRPATPALLDMKTTYHPGETVTFAWKPTANTTHYNIYLDKKGEDGEYSRFENVFYAESGLTRTPEEGSYRVRLQSTNKNYYESDGKNWLYKNAEWVEFEVAHTYVPTITAPTCTANGYTTYACTGCGDKYVADEVAAPGHDLIVDSAVAATCTEDGLTEGSHCSRCDYKVEQQVVAKLGHSYRLGVCTRCGEKDPDYRPVEFIDVPTNAWYKDAVDYAVGMGLMNGVGGGKFAPEDSMTRAMLVTVLWRYADSPTEGTNRFTDVPGGQWYTAAVAWAAGKGVVNGTSETTFEPDGNVTREQMAAILYRYANSISVDTGKRGDFTAFADANAVSGWAKDALSWTVAEGIIGGSKEGGQLLLNPAGNATRAQVAAILMRFIENVTK